jgi:hypothetical protein
VFWLCNCWAQLGVSCVLLQAVLCSVQHTTTSSKSVAAHQRPANTFTAAVLLQGTIWPCGVVSIQQQTTVASATATNAALQGVLAGVWARGPRWSRAVEAAAESACLNPGQRSTVCTTSQDVGLGSAVQDAAAASYVQLRTRVSSSTVCWKVRSTVRVQRHDVNTVCTD